ncbi:hypothetical protein ANN_14181 [Periplaneta americana]|uniref:Uncharacterized protein n=1 Tax=Periplaneta americana TaxID=6978 RepID=A0ABQ8SX48_PERAM|nr:hypothetical protein ANN_14181 [Periplaneta americana]
MVDLREGGNEPAGSLKAICCISYTNIRKMAPQSYSVLTSKWADNRQATNFECTLTPCDLNCGFLLTNSDVYYANQDFSDVYYANQDFRYNSCKVDLNNFEEKLFRSRTSKWADNRQATNFECTLTPCDLNCGFLLTNSDVYYANQDFRYNSCKVDLNNFEEKLFRSRTSKWADNRQATNFECTLTPCDLNCGFLLTNSDVYYANQDFSELSEDSLDPTIGTNKTSFMMQPGQEPKRSGTRSGMDDCRSSLYKIKINTKDELITHIVNSATLIKERKVDFRRAEECIELLKVADIV